MAVCDPLLVAVDDEMLAVGGLGGCGGDVFHVGAGVGLGHGKAAALLAGEDVWDHAASMELAEVRPIDFSKRNLLLLDIVRPKPQQGRQTDDLQIPC